MGRGTLPVFTQLVSSREHPLDTNPGHVEAARHLRILRDLLARDYLSVSDWNAALADLARNVRGAVAAQEAMVALWHEDTQQWDAVASGGETLRDDTIAGRGSRSALEQVRTLEEPVLTFGDQEISIDSESIQSQHILGFLVVPLYFRDTTQAGAARRFGGCIYAHRTADRDPFTAGDVEIVVDIARIAQPSLNLLRHLAALEEDLEASRREVRELRQRSAREHHIGLHRVPPSVYETLSRILDNQKVTLLILGPTGSGKSQLARAYHYACPRRDSPFVVLDCGSVTSSETLSAELFGYAPSSGYANAPRGGSIGKARMAHQGTLFIDEIANLSLELQPRLLRLIQEGRFGPLGAGHEQVVDIQIIAATNADLARRVAEGSFREDLFHRLDVVRVVLPGLDQRTDEIPEIARTILERVSAEAGKDARGLTEAAVATLARHDWEREGNIRGLENLLRRSVWAAPRGLATLDVDHLRFLGDTPAAARSAAPGPAPAADDGLEDLKAAIRRHRNATEAAAALGLSYRQLYWRLQRAGLSVRDVLAGR
jgi:transcriptional regulator with GAF, ATPase, and Fis domain